MMPLLQNLHKKTQKKKSILNFIIKFARLQYTVLHDITLFLNSKTKAQNTLR